MAKIIDCALHDYIEVACIYGYRVSVTLTSGSVYVGKPLTTVTEPGPREFLHFQQEGEPIVEQKIPLDELHTMTALNPGALFDTITF